MDPVSYAVKGMVVVGLSALLPFTAVSFFRFWRPRKLNNYKKIVKIFGLTLEGEDVSEDELSDGYTKGSFVLPVIFVLTVSLIGFSIALFGNDLIDVDAHLLLGGPGLLAGPGGAGVDSVMQQAGATPAVEEPKRRAMFSMMVLGLAFLTAYLWSCQNIVRRLITGDLSPGTYYSASLRMVLAPLIALMLSYLPGAMTLHKLTLVAAFLTGMFPDEAILYLKQKISVFSAPTVRAHHLSRDMIEGITVFHKARLNEVGIDNGENLAEANVIDLLLKTPFKARQLIDWIAQAKLYVFFKEEFDALRGSGVRTVFDLKRLASDDGAIEALAAATRIAPFKLAVVARSIAGDPDVDRLERFRNRLCTIATMDAGSAVASQPRATP